MNALAAVAVVAALATSIAPREPSGERLIAGPALSGDDVVWATDAGAELLVRSGTRVLQRHARQREHSSFWIDGLGASSSVVGFRLQESFCPPPIQVGPNHWVVESCRVTHRTLAGNLSRPFGVVSSPVVCRGAIVHVNASPDAERDVAWSSGRTIVVYDWRSGAERYRVDVDISPYGAFRFDLQDDGKTAAAYSVGGDRPFTKVVWFSRDQRSGRFVANLPDVWSEVRLAKDYVVFEHVTRGRTAVVLSDLRGNARELAGYGAATRVVGAIDFDGTRVAWATVDVAHIFMDCPPPGMGRPCLPRYDGVRSIWTTRVEEGAQPRLVARDEFRGQHDIGAGVEFQGIPSRAS